jgi:hypothetical protein
MNNYPGRLAQFIRWYFWLIPADIRSALEMFEVKLSGKGPFPKVIEEFQGNQ